MAKGIPARLTPREGRKFGLTVGIAFLVLSGIVVWRGHLQVATVLGGLGGALALAGVVVPQHLGPVYRAWMALAHALSKVTTPIFMGLVYFVVITPAGLLRRTLSRNPMVAMSRDGSVWVPRDPEKVGDMERQF